MRPGKQKPMFEGLASEQRVITRLGFPPTTVWKPDIAEQNKWKAYVGDKGQEREGAWQGGGAYDIGASVFSPVLAAMLLDAYAPPGGRVYDPFAGGGTRAIVCAALGYKYTGVELRENEVHSIQKRIAELMPKLGEASVEVVVGDGMNFWPTDRMCTYDFCLTCPPYWNLERYGGDPTQDLSEATTYGGYLGMLHRAAQCVRYLVKPGKFCAWVFGDLRQEPNGDMLLLHADAARVICSAGFQMHDLIIWQGYGSVHAQRWGQFDGKNKRLVRDHEFVLIVRPRWTEQPGSAGMEEALSFEPLEEGGDG